MITAGRLCKYVTGSLELTRGAAARTAACQAWASEHVYHRSREILSVKICRRVIFRRLPATPYPGRTAGGESLGNTNETVASTIPCRFAACQDGELPHGSEGTRTHRSIIMLQEALSNLLVK